MGNNNRNSKQNDILNTDKLLSSIINIGTVVLFFCIVIAIYYIFLRNRRGIRNF